MTSWIRARADRVRDTPLEPVLRRLGGELDRADQHKWHTAVGTVSVCGPKFMNWSRGTGGGGAIDLVMHLRGGGFLDAVAWLERELGTVTAEPAVSPGPRPALQLPRPDPGKLATIQAYLVAQRAIPGAVLDSLIRSGVLFADGRANAVFLLRDSGGLPVGAELRGTGPYPWRGMAPGSQKDRGFFAAGTESAVTIVICESAIDAISCSILHPQYRCVSTSGARPDPPWLDSIVARGQELCCGFDADCTGDLLARAMIARHPQIKRLRPALKDWNDVLRSKT